MEPFFSIVTPSLNCGPFLSRNLESVRSQGLDPSLIEHWVIDGGSTDCTLDILRQHPEVNWISEKDNGLSHAVNKGINRATGKWIIWLNADDALAPKALATFLEFCQKFPEIKIFCGDQNIYDYSGNFECFHPGWEYTFEALLEENTDIAQASIFVHRSVYDAIGLLDENFRYAMDYEWLVRACKAFSCRHFPVVFTNYHRRRGSIMDAGIYGQHLDFLRTRKKHKCSRFSRMEFRYRLYLTLEPLRRNAALRLAVRKIKAALGIKLHQGFEPRP